MRCSSSTKKSDALALTAIPRWKHDILFDLSTTIGLVSTWIGDGLRIPVKIAYGHTALKTRHLVRSVKLSNVWPGQYLDRRRLGNPKCCKHFCQIL
uniref:C2 PI3K-type domain-containing protein n=1 Tax=Enterobius vermicularis TaxID=51028 RepID=A0A0N4V2F1_ENTVE